MCLLSCISVMCELIVLSQTIRTACSSALTCLNEACLAVSRGDCEGALVGATNLIMSPTMTSAMTEQGVLSKEGACKTFSADADGYARGEAITAIYVKSLKDALKDGNPIRGVYSSEFANQHVVRIRALCALLFFLIFANSDRSPISRHKGYIT